MNSLHRAWIETSERYKRLPLRYKVFLFLITPPYVWISVAAKLLGCNFCLVVNLTIQPESETP